MASINLIFGLLLLAAGFFKEFMAYYQLLINLVPCAMYAAILKSNQMTSSSYKVSGVY